MQTINPVTPQTVKDAFVASKQNGTRRATVVHVRNGVETNCHGFMTVNGNVVLIVNSTGPELLTFEAGDVLKYNDEPS